MQATPEQLKTLNKLQEADREALLAQHELDALPQKGEIERNKKRLAKVTEDASKVEEMYQSAKHSLQLLQDEDQQLADRQDSSKDRVDNAQGDFRSVTSLTRDLEGIAKRRETLEFEMGKANDRLAEISKVRQQAMDAKQQLEDRQQKLQATYDEQSSKLKQQYDEQKAIVDKLEPEVPADLLKVYHRAYRHCGGVALSYLVDGNHCSACRSAIPENRLIEIKREAPISVCPSCHRLLIVDE